MASGGRPGLAQALFQVGGNTGQALGPLTAALIVALIRPAQYRLVCWPRSAGLCSCCGRWGAGTNIRDWRAWAPTAAASGLAARRESSSGCRPAAADLSKYLYLTSISSYYTFYLIHAFGLSVEPGAIASVHLPGGGGGGTWRAGRWAIISGAIVTGCRSWCAALTLMLLRPICLDHGSECDHGFVMASAFPPLSSMPGIAAPAMSAGGGLFFGYPSASPGWARALGRAGGSCRIALSNQVCAFLGDRDLTFFLPDFSARKRP